MQFQEKIKIFYDGTNLEKYCKISYVSGITTNTSFMKQSGFNNYKDFYETNRQHIRNLPISFQIFDEDEEIAYKDAMHISEYGGNTYVKVPVINSKGVLNASLIQHLLASGIKLNITAIYTTEQLLSLHKIIKAYDTPIIVSIFCGRISDTSRDPSVIVKSAIDIFRYFPNVEILWAGCKEVLSIQHAIDVGCHIITVPDSIFDRINRIDQDLTEMSIDTVQSFKKDALTAHIVI
jgi:transaldolase